MKRLTIAVAFVVFCAGWCIGQVKPMTGGRTWREYPEREMYAVGFKQGYVRGASDAGSLVMLLTDKSLTPSQKDALTPDSMEAQKAMKAISNNSALVLAAAVSSFYNDEQNVSVCWEDAMMFSAASISGNEPTAHELDVARKKGAEKGCR